MANISGLTQNKRKLIIEATNSMLLYGSVIGGDELKVKSKVQEALQRTAALGVASTYRTVSAAAVLVISRETSIDLLAKEQKKALEAKGQGSSISKA